MKNDFTPNSIDTNTQVLANYLPIGRIFDAKNINGSKLRSMLAALAQELTRAQNKNYELSTEYYLPTTTNLIDEWEKALGIPDDCFKTNVSLSQRRLQIVAKFARMNIVTEQDWIDLAAFFGFEISISHLSIYVTFPMVFPIIFTTSKEIKFTMVINFIGIPQPSNVFPLTFPLTFSNPVNILQCLFEHLKPANVKIIYKYIP